MRHLIPILALALAVLLAGCGGEEGKTDPGPAKDPKTTVPAVDMEKVLAEARESGKNVLIEYYAVSCNFCRQMDEETFSDPDVKETLGNVIHVRLHQNQNATFFEKRWGKMGTPTFVVLKPDGTQLGEAITGIVEVGDFLIYLDWAATGEDEQPEIKTGGS